MLQCMQVCKTEWVDVFILQPKLRTNIFITMELKWHSVVYALNLSCWLLSECVKKNQMHTIHRLYLHLLWYMNHMLGSTCVHVELFQRLIAGGRQFELELLWEKRVSSCSLWYFPTWKGSLRVPLFAFWGNLHVSTYGKFSQWGK